MILQCDQCNTKFRLDDSKLKPGGVKVRCSKCRHVFVAGAEAKQEESEFDALLSGLGAPAPEKGEEREEPAAQEPARFEVPEPPAARPQAKEAAAKPEAGLAAPATPPPAPEAAAAPSAPVSDFPDFDAFDFSAEPAAKPAAAPAAAEEESDFNVFDFSSPEEGTVKEEAEATTPSQGLDYGEFAFMEEPAAPKEEPEPAAAGGFDFSEFAFTPEPAPAAQEPKPAEPAAGLDFGEFEFNAEPTAASPEPAAPELDFGDFSFNEEPVVTPADEEAADKAGVAAAGKDTFDFGEFSFGEEAAVKPEAAGAPKEEFDFGDFSFGEEPPPLTEAPADVAAQKQAGTEMPKEDIFSLGDLSLSQDKEAPAVAAPARGAGRKAGAEAAAAGAAGIVAAGMAAAVAGGGAGGGGTVPPAGPAGPAAGEGAVPPVQPGAGRKQQPASTSTLDFSFGGKPGVAGATEEVEEEEELPPLVITSRRKGRSWLTISLAVISIVIILALTGAGLYLLQSGPAAVQKLDKMGLGFVGKWFGVETAEEGRIEIRNPLASFYQNKEAGELFVVTGEALNNYKKARASIHVKVSIFDKKGAVLMQKTAYCGNKLTKEQLETLPMSKIDAIMNNQFGDSLSNLGVKPGQAIGFVVAIPNVPKEAADFGVEVLGSTVAAAQ